MTEWTHRDGDGAPYRPEGFCVSCDGLRPWPCDAERMRVERDAAIRRAEALTAHDWSATDKASGNHEPDAGNCLRCAIDLLIAEWEPEQGAVTEALHRRREALRDRMG